MSALIQVIKALFYILMSFLSDIVLSIIDYIKDLPANSLEHLTGFLTKFLDWASSYCAYCLGGTTLEGAGSAVSVFAKQMQAAYDGLSPCVVYALTQSGLQGDLQILSCAMVIWSMFRVASLIKSLK